MDGLFGAGLEEAVKRYQRDHRLKVTAQIQLVEYLQLGLWE
jgi:peptidoglycan hydrolase-like protein with peptidoglycan-binding domain